MRRVLSTLASTLTAVLLLSSCGSGGGSGAASDAVSDGDGAAAAQHTVEDLQSAAGEDAEPQVVSAELPVIATRETVDNDIPLGVDLNAVTVSGKIMTVLFTAHNLDKDDQRWQIAGFFDDGSGNAPLDSDGKRSEQFDVMLMDSTDGITVLDTVNGALYHAAYDSARSCLCDVDLGNSFVASGQAIVLMTAFAAPPEDVETVTVYIPGAGSFDNVPLTR